MSMMEKMMEFMMGRMSQEDKEDMMDKMMDEFFTGMTAEDKQGMMAAMMPKMMEGINMMDMMPRMMMNMMGGEEAEGRMPGATAEARERGEGAQAPMMPKMMMEMMPRCLEMMLPQTPPEARTDFVLRMVGTLVEKGCAGMSEEDKNNLVVRLNEKMQSILGRPTAA